MIILICGLPGTGKSFLAKKLASKLSCRHINTDIVRKEKIKEPGYSEKEKHSVYDAVVFLAEEALKKKQSVILDGTFYKSEFRKKAEQLAKKHKKGFYIIELVTPLSEVKRRLDSKKNVKSDSAADFDVYKIIKAEFEPIKEYHLIIDSTRPLKDQIAEVVNYLGAGVE